MTLQKLMDTLKRKRDEYALQALRCPEAKSEFEYGLRCGIVQCYEGVIAELKTIQHEEARDGQDL